MSSVPTIPEYFSGKNIFITGGSGFIGKVLIEKLLRSCPDIGKIYMLIRPKKAKSPEERIQFITDLPLYDVLKDTYPENLSKIVPITGDVMKLELGLSADDKKMLIEEVNIVYHIAASVRFDDRLKDAVLMNTRGTREVARLSKEIKNLEVLIHFSTTYCHTDRDIVKEQMYPPHADWEETIELAESMDSHVLDVLTEKYIQPLVNTYTFTKSLAEHVIQDLCDGQIPSIIFRPSIVISTMTEPFSGWIDNFNGPVGILAATGKGVMRTSYANSDVVADFIPCDSIVKGVIMATWNKGIENDKSEKNKLSVYNASSHNVKSVTYDDIAVYGMRISWDYPLNDILWKPNCAHRSSWYVFYVEFICFQLLPSLFVDTLLSLSGRKPMLIRIQRKIYLTNMALTHFLTNQWTFLNKKTLNLENNLLPSDFPAFNYETNHKQTDTYNYFTSAVIGFKKYVLKESDDTLEQAKIHYKRMYLISLVCGFLLYLLGILILFYIYTRVDWIARMDGIYAYFDKL